MRPDYKNAIDFSDNGIGSIGSIYITGGGFVNREFKGITPNSAFGWNEFVWGKTPSRNADFSFGNMDNTDVGIVARCELTIGYMDIQDYMDLRQILTTQRHFMVKFFNRDTGGWMTRDMYCSEQSLRQLYTLNQLVIGGFELTLKFVGTNNDIVGNRNKPATITYNLTNPNGISGTGTVPASETKSYSEQYTTAGTSGIIAPTGYHLAGWVTMEGGNTTGYHITGYYGLNQSITVWEDMNFYANWESD